MAGYFLQVLWIFFWSLNDMYENEKKKAVKNSLPGWMVWHEQLLWHCHPAYLLEELIYTTTEHFDINPRYE